MKKMMFNDRYGLTQAVIKERKTVTRRIVSDKLWDRWTDYDDFCNSVSCGPSTPVVRQYYNEFEFFKDNLPYRIGEIVAVAQSYDQINPQIVHCRIDDLGDWGGDHPGQYNKMFVQADLMPHQIRITSVRPERLQDITDEDCMKEGIQVLDGRYYYRDSEGRIVDDFDNPRAAFASLINKISGRGTWELNPFVWVYEFKLVK